MTTNQRESKKREWMKNESIYQLISWNFTYFIMGKMQIEIFISNPHFETSQVSTKTMDRDLLLHADVVQIFHVELINL